MSNLNYNKLLRLLKYSQASEWSWRAKFGGMVSTLARTVRGFGLESRNSYNNFVHQLNIIIRISI